MVVVSRAGIRGLGATRFLFLVLYKRNFATPNGILDFAYNSVPHPASSPSCMGKPQPYRSYCTCRPSEFNVYLRLCKVRIDKRLAVSQAILICEQVTSSL